MKDCNTPSRGCSEYYKKMSNFQIMSPSILNLKKNVVKNSQFLAKNQINLRNKSAIKETFQM